MFRPIARIAAPPCCSTSGRRHSAAQGQPALIWHEPSSQRRRPTHVCRASEDVQADDKDAAAEARLEAYERGAKRRQGSRAVAASERRAALLRAEQKGGDGLRAEWPEKQLLPDGWETMNFGQRLTELYLGKRGALFWFNKAAYASIYIIFGGWVVFRFVLPALGLYSLTNDLTSPPAP